MKAFLLETVPHRVALVQARDAGIDVADAAAVLEHALSQRPGDRHWEEFCRDLLEPPYPAFDRGRALHMLDWPPGSGRLFEEDP